MTQRPLRKDAERNREALLCAAQDLFAERGLDVGLNEIARTAGVGVGTAYRHFPDKGDLVDVLFHRRMDEIVTLAEQAATAADPWDGIVARLEGWLQLHLSNRSLSELFLDPDVGDERADTSRDRIAPALNALAERAQAAGRTREDFTGTDIFFIQLSLVGLIDRSRRLQPDLYRRYLGMMLEGARIDPDPHRALPVAPLGTSEAHDLVMSHRTRIGTSPE